MGYRIDLSMGGDRDDFQYSAPQPASRDFTLDSGVVFYPWWDLAFLQGPSGVSQSVH
jgi:hypothetical protein